MAGDGGRRQLAIALSVRLIQHLDIGDHVCGHGVTISGFGSMMRVPTIGGGFLGKYYW
jgi:hypothetical protein